jgi:hypothetical protein
VPADDQDIWYTGAGCQAPDSDCDGILDTVETQCGSDPNNVAKIPERRDSSFAGRDDDGDNLVDEALPSSSAGYDCDGDGYTGAAEDNVFGATASGNQDACGTSAWPADIVTGEAPEIPNTVTLADVVSYIAPVRRLDTSPGDVGFDLRWDIVPGAGTQMEVVNLADLTSLVSVAPPMLGGARAFGGPACPWP